MTPTQRAKVEDHPLVKKHIERVAELEKQLKYAEKSIAHIANNLLIEKCPLVESGGACACTGECCHPAYHALIALVIRMREKRDPIGGGFR